jgi:hypothetical protein
VYEVVDAPKVADEVYKASLYLSPVVCVKLCFPSNSSFLKEFAIAFVVIAIFTPYLNLLRTR